MSRRVKLIIAAVVVVLVLAGALYLLRKSQKPQSDVGKAANESGVTLKGLLGMGKDQKCDISYSNDRGKTSGTVYVAGKKMRGDFTVVDANNKQMDSHMITDETYIYSWLSSSPQGVKTKVEAAIIDQQVQYKCASWGVDSSKFTPPSNVQFRDLSTINAPATQTQPAGSGTPTK